MKIFLGGRSTRGEFDEVRRDVTDGATLSNATLTVREQLGVDRSTRQFEDGAEPTLDSLYDVDLFILCRSFPNEFNVSDVESLRRVAPLAPIVLIAGALCEGENRTGETFPGVRRFYVETWRETGVLEFRQFLDPEGASGFWTTLPLATNVDRLIKSPTESDRKNDLPKSTLVVADDPAMRVFLTSTFQRSGVDTTSTKLSVVCAQEWEETFQPELIVVDTVDLADPFLLEILDSIHTRFPSSKITILAFAARADEIARFETTQRLGQIRVLAKPFETDALLYSGTSRGYDEQ